MLAVDVDAAATRSLGVDELAVDPATAGVIEQAVADARERAYREGVDEGRAEVRQQLNALGTAVRGAVGELRAEFAAEREHVAAASLELARAAATAVLDRTPPDEALVVLERVRAALDLLDDGPLTVRLHPDDQAVVADAAGDLDQVEFVADARLDRGEAAVSGPYSAAQLTRAAMLEAALEALAEEAS
ncbi:MAG: FliH/SctL family protein [Nitriliruptoraceae bacterium]